MKSGEFKTRKEAAWAIVNATSGGTPEQIRYLVDQGTIPPLCDFLTSMDVKIIQVALNGLENILKVGEDDARVSGTINKYAVLIEQCYGNCFLRSYSIWCKMTFISQIYGESYLKLYFYFRSG